MQELIGVIDANELKKIAGDVNPGAIPTEVITIAVNLEVSINFCTIK
ncbi:MULTISPECIES: class II lanthipeptide, LchA2/BrtA2 family [Bacillus]|nr:MULTISPECIES: class II lanthipeptide, LchA2/BrtA2 family [Bacillus]MED2885838.1 class II lanthipeptide, LchA2/BrtA2 family [Bacillus wiedmannii]USL16779.1 class II lanthipeptide, LchA2/BrtA2 family [Bacillus thuringiensis]